MTPNKNLSVPKNEQSKEHELNLIGKKKKKRRRVKSQNKINLKTD
jgi:hypothetical protein